MEYQKIINLLDNRSTHASKFGTKNWVEIKDDARGTYNTNGEIKFKICMLKSGLYDYTDAYIIVKGRVTITWAGVDADERQANEGSKEVIFKNCSPFTDSMSEINNTQVDNTKDLHVSSQCISW